jgi:hypothetical protein
MGRAPSCSSTTSGSESRATAREGPGSLVARARRRAPVGRFSGRLSAGSAVALWGRALAAAMDGLAAPADGLDSAAGRLDAAAIGLGVASACGLGGVSAVGLGVSAVGLASDSTCGAAAVRTGFVGGAGAGRGTVTMTAVRGGRAFWLRSGSTTARATAAMTLAAPTIPQVRGGTRRQTRTREVSFQRGGGVGLTPDSSTDATTSLDPASRAGGGSRIDSASMGGGPSTTRVGGSGGASRGGGNTPSRSPVAQGIDEGAGMPGGGGTTDRSPVVRPRGMTGGAITSVAAGATVTGRSSDGRLR